ncbi:hypothetical protein VKT23_016622 [Stygiomarasmius scandens]|uniref:Uncharacterized protein n=1 Tax=Marasmiellus scandens TaxID=2682957 RepID=A0ABR1IXI5_9AGAR
MFAEWDGLSVSAGPFFDVYETAITNHLHQDERLEADVQDTPHLESDNAASPADSTNPSPLSSPPPSPAIPRAVSPQPGEKRKSRTRRSNKEKKDSPNTPGSTPTSAPTPLLPNHQKKSTARSHISRANQRKKEKEEHGPANYRPRAEVGETLLQTASPLPACLNSNDIKDATSGYLGQASRVSKESKKVRKIWKLDELCGPGSLGFTYVPASTTPRPILDRNDVVVGTVVPPPQGDQEWASQLNDEAMAALERERNGAANTNESKQSKRQRKAGLSFTKNEELHRRGGYFIKVDGVSAGGGQKV